MQFSFVIFVTGSNYVIILMFKEKKWELYI